MSCFSFLTIANKAEISLPKSIYRYVNKLSLSADSVQLLTQGCFSRPRPTVSTSLAASCSPASWPLSPLPGTYLPPLRPRLFLLPPVST